MTPAAFVYAWLWSLAVLGPRPDDRNISAASLMTQETQDSIDRGLGWLAKRQNQDGSFGSGGYAGNIAVTGLAGLAFMTAGHMPGEGPYGDTVDRAIAYVLENTNTSGFIESRQSGTHGPMYGHGFGCLFLAEAYGMTLRPEIREKLKKSVLLIISSQNREGGWRYQPAPNDADLSVTVCQIMALRAARNAGIAVPKEVVDRCTLYVRRCQNADGGFMYMSHGGSSAPPRSAAGVVALNSAGVYEGKEIEKGLEYLMQNALPLPATRGARRQSHYFYGHYYAVQAMWQAGGDYWDKWYPAIREELLRSQSPPGYWEDSSVCSEYGTAMAIIILQTPNTHLPIFQR